MTWHPRRECPHVIPEQDVDDVAGSGSREEKAQKRASLNILAPFCLGILNLYKGSACYPVCLQILSWSDMSPRIHLLTRAL